MQGFVTTEKASKAMETFAERTADSYKVVADHFAGLQERNVRFARGFVENFASEVRHQAEANRALTEELVERAEKQRGTFQTVVEESVDTYWNAAFAPLTYTRAFYREGMERTREVADKMSAVSDISTGLPISNYDEKNVGEVTRELDGLSVEDLRKVRVYEKAHKNRDTVVEQIDRKIKAAS